jgi:hypothetical protein
MKMNQKKKRKETFGYIPLTKKGNSLAKLFADLLADEKKIFQYFRMGFDKFTVLLNLIEEKITFKNTNFR